MASFPSFQFVTSRGFTYNYIHIPPSGNGTYLLFLHGFPSSSYDWRFQIPHFSKKGYGIVAPDCLGYGGTSKPVDMHAYKGKAMANDIAEILKHEKIDKAIGIGHDWGSFLLSRLVNFHSSLFTKLVFLDVGYAAPGHGLTRTTLNFINNAIQTSMGYSIFGYFLFFDEDDAAGILDENPESAESLFFSTDAELGKKYLGALGGFREWLTAGKIAPSPAFVSAQDKAHFRELFLPEKGGFAGPINWYKAQIHDVNSEDDSEIPETDHILRQPTLLISGGNNFVATAADFGSQMKPFAPNFVNEKFDCGHWIMLEKADETNKRLEAFIS